ncbi:VCBS repeat-containing protein [Rhodocytophaga aerolata]|uniref:VCBS repeat-containing protein n=1 Tax=Rhodocytophaga aerolata TaxID=455078 RepID=A0ABT8RD70_9BACT|nr:VCBS repeat-containing protein [Rhodocytophaga aerolata]MDO1449289.1 VCBS repeat-containing protein [Rhodocytophaga aerolata]
MKYCCFILILLLWGCKDQSTSSSSLFTILPGSQTGVRFENTVAENDSFNLVDYYYVYNGGGVAVGDLNNDELPDLYFTGNQVGDRLYLNKGNMKFEDITEKAGILKGGWSTGVTMADVNADGLLDIYVCKSGNYPGARRANQLYINKGNLQFQETSHQYGLADTTYTNQAAFLDYDKDGDLDLFLLTSTNQVRNPNIVRPVIADGTGLANDKLYRNDSNASDSRFTDVTQSAGILHDGFGLGISVADFNDDGWEDIYVANDFLANDFLYLNQQDGTFAEVGKTYFKHHSQFSMGCDAADINNDGLTDLVVADMLPADNEQRKKMAGPASHQHFESIIRAGYHPQFMRNMLQVNLGKAPDGRMVFAEIGQFAGVYSTDWSWSPLLADLDNDGWRDLFITNGYLRDITDMDFVAYNDKLARSGTQTAEDINAQLRKGAIHMATLRKTNRFFQNRRDLTFEDVTTSWFGTEESLSNGTSYADLDRDGDLDLLVNNVNQEAYILQNNTTKSNYLQVRLQGSAGNLFGLGTKLIVHTNGIRQTSHQSVSRGYQSSVDYIQHFGLGTTKQIDSLTVIWPDGNIQILRNLPVNQLLTVSYAQSKPASVSKEAVQIALLKNVTDSVGVQLKHQEEPYLDYNQEPLLLHKLSQQGPKLTAGDVNGDGLEDLFVGGSFRHYGKLLIQTSGGRFVEKSYTDESKPKDEEDVDVLFFDADRDNDQDLYIVSGSNEYYDGSQYFQDRIYLNSGKGNFTNATHLLPSIRHSGSCIAAVDFDKDGDIDLFRGGRGKALQYPLAGKSYLLKNEGGRFTDVTEELATGLREIGMVTDAVWADVDGDSWPDLIVVGEFMPITVFKNNGGNLHKVAIEGLQGSEGFWNCIRSGDFDKDGDIDFIAGNMGLNSRYRLSPSQPLSYYVGDYDNNGRMDAIASYFLNGKEYPIASRDELGRQLPLIKFRFTNYASYAKAQISELLPPERFKASTVVRAYRQESVYLENTGTSFRIKTLPALAQWAPVQSIWVEDVDQDGNLDALCVGNAYDAEPIVGKYDAFTGLLLKGDGKGGFHPLLFPQTGFLADGDCKSVIGIQGQRHSFFVVGVNNGLLQVFQRLKSHL